MQTFFGHTGFIRLLCVCFSEKRIPTLYQPNPHDGGWSFENIQYLIRLEKHIYVSLEKVFHFGNFSGYSNSFIYILRKIKMEKCLEIYRYSFLAPALFK